jgi:hypothetical protein
MVAQSSFCLLPAIIREARIRDALLSTQSLPFTMRVMRVLVMACG